MKLKKSLAFLLAASATVCAVGCNGGNPQNGNEVYDNIRLIVLCGQSNAVGYSQSEYLIGTEFESALDGYKSVKINLNYGEGSLLGVSPKMSAVTSDLGTSFAAFGPELGIAKAVTESVYANNTAIVKYAVGGTSIDPQTHSPAGYWNAPSTQFADCAQEGLLYTKLCSTVDFVIETYTQQGLTPVIEAICWMQGENEAASTTVPITRYDALETEFITSLREKYAHYASGNGIAFIDAGISTAWKNYVTLNEAKKSTVSKLDFAEYIDTIDMDLTYDREPEGNPDRAHFDAVPMMKLGYEFGKRALSHFDAQKSKE